MHIQNATAQLANAEALNDKLRRRVSELECFLSTALCRVHALENILAAISERHADEAGYEARVGGEG